MNLKENFLNHSYKIRLSTREFINITEFIETPLLDRILDLCTKMPREIIEEAKMGYDTNFKKLLGRDPKSCLGILDASCDLKSECQMFNSSECSSKFLRRGKPSFPICFHFNDSISSDIISCWRNDSYVILVSQKENLLFLP